MKSRLVISGLLALICVSALASGDTYSMTYQTTATSHPVTVQLLSFAVARAVHPPADGGPTSGAQRHESETTNRGQFRMGVGKKSAVLSSTFKKGSQFSKMTISLSGVTPAGATAPIRHWTITDAVIDSYAVTGAGPSAQAIINLHWKTIAVAAP